MCRKQLKKCPLDICDNQYKIIFLLDIEIEESTSFNICNLKIFAHDIEFVIFDDLPVLHKHKIEKHVLIKRSRHEKVHCNGYICY